MNYLTLTLFVFILLACGHDFSSTTGFYSPPTCSVSSVTGGVLVSCPDGTSAFLPNGAMGATGPQGAPGETSPYLPIGIIQPCGPGSSAYKETLFILYNGTVLASFSNTLGGDYTRLTLLPDGFYIDTDNSLCAFSLTTLNNIRTCSWAGGSQSWLVR